MGIDTTEQMQTIRKHGCKRQGRMQTKKTPIDNKDATLLNIYAPNITEVTTVKYGPCVCFV